MKERGIMPPMQRLIFHPLFSKIFLCVLTGVYLAYLVGFGQFLSSSLLTSSRAIRVDQVDTNPGVVVQYWTAAHMQDAIDADVRTSLAPVSTQVSVDTSEAKAV